MRIIKTYQDLVALGNDEKKRMDFVRDCVSEHKSSEEYKIAADAEEYYAKRNVTMEKYVKVIRNSLGQIVPDVWSSNYKLVHSFFRQFVLQQTQYILSNGVTFSNEGTKSQLGTKRKEFDRQLSTLAKSAMVAGVSFGLWDKDHIEVFYFADTKNHPGFVPVPDRDERTLKAGVRYWECADKTLRWTLYELDGFTEFVQNPGEKMKILSPKKAYITKTNTTEIFGTEVIGESNYNGFPIIPMYANDLRESELVGIRPSIDCYDFIKSGMANNVDETSAFYWALENAGGMDDVDLVEFVNRMKQLHAANLPSGVTATPGTISVPVEANELLLKSLKNDLYENFMLMNPTEALAGDKTATAIRLAYQPQDDKCGDFEYCIREFIGNLLELVGIDDEPSFKWNRIANQTEETQMIMTASPVLDEETVIDKLPFLTPEEAKTVKERKSSEEIGRFQETKEEVTEEVIDVGNE